MYVLAKKGRNWPILNDELEEFFGGALRAAPALPPLLDDDRPLPLHVVVREANLLSKQPKNWNEKNNGTVYMYYTIMFRWQVGEGGGEIIETKRTWNKRNETKKNTTRQVITRRRQEH